MPSKRRSFEKGHKRKYLVVIDDSEECDRAVHWAAQRAKRTKSVVVMLRVIETGDHGAQWLGVADIMRAESMEAAKTMLNKSAERAKNAAAVKVDLVIREGSTPDEILRLIEEDADIGILVLGAGTGKEGPGPLVSHIGKTAGTFPIPIAIVPGHLSDDEIDASS
jgi:nucleotide-binding universal stress UspA family protein